jgi:hypothetical protein
MQAAGGSHVGYAELAGIDANPERQARAVRALLLLMAEDEALRPRLQAALTAGVSREITTALALAGIVLALSTNIEIAFDNVGGKKRFHFKLERKPTTEALLGKFFALFGK